MWVRWISVTAIGAALVLGSALAGATGPGGWDHLGQGATTGSPSLNGNVHVLNDDAPGALLVGGEFTNAGGNPLADRIASWNGSAWTAVGAASDQISGGVYAIAQAGGKIYAGGTFQNAGGHADADNLAVWDGQNWASLCGPIEGNVEALQVIGTKLFVGGTFQDGADIATADYLLVCDLVSGDASSAFADPAEFLSGPVLALAADSDGGLYAGGSFSNVADVEAADNVAYLSSAGLWHPLGSGGGSCGCAINGYVRALLVAGDQVYVGTDVKDVAGIAQADNVVRWDGAAWNAVGAGTGGSNGWFPPTTYIYALENYGSSLFATGGFQDAAGDPRADNVAWFDGADWHPVGSNGAGNGPWVGEGHGLAMFPGTTTLYAGGGFASAGGDTQARSVASFNLAQIIAFPTPTVTAAPPTQPVPTPTVTAAPQPTPAPDTTAPKISALRLSATTFRAASSGPAFRAARVPIGAIVTFTVSEAGKVRFTADRCSRRSGARCTRWRAVRGSFTVAGRRGANRIELRGRMGGRTLKPGRYRLKARATDRATNRSRTTRTAFRIVR